MQNPNSRKRAGDECYTPDYVVERLQQHYVLYNKNIWLPFCVESSPFYQILKADNNVILSPASTKIQLNENLSLFEMPNESYKFKKTNAPYYYDFWLAIKDKNFINKIINEKFIIFDNPPFTDLSTKIWWINYFKIPFFLFSNALTVSSIFYIFRQENIDLGFEYIEKINFENENKKKPVGIAILTNTHTKMKGCFALRKMTTKPLQGIIDTNLMHPTDLFKFLRRGYEFDTKDYNVFLLDKNKFCGYCFCKKK